MKGITSEIMVLVQLTEQRIKKVSLAYTIEEPLEVKEHKRVAANLITQMELLIEVLRSLEKLFPLRYKYNNIFELHTYVRVAISTALQDHTVKPLGTKLSDYRGGQ